MANYKVPRTVAFIDELPYNATGKIMKDVLRARASAHQDQKGQP
jgi:acyl-coenzyme A synthetase/AMP-(fatty) acid ligase